MNNSITLNNYEKYIIDYFDDNLPKKERNAFNAFLNQNPTIKEDFLEGRKLVLLAPVVDYPHKAALRRKKSLSLPIWSKYSIVAAVVLLFAFIYIANQRTIRLLEEQLGQVRAEKSTIEEANPAYENQDVLFVTDVEELEVRKGETAEKPYVKHLQSQVAKVVETPQHNVVLENDMDKSVVTSHDSFKHAEQQISETLLEEVKKESAINTEHSMELALNEHVIEDDNKPVIVRENNQLVTAPTLIEDGFEIETFLDDVTTPAAKEDPLGISPNTMPAEVVPTLLPSQNDNEEKSGFLKKPANLLINVLNLNDEDKNDNRKEFLKSKALGIEIEVKKEPVNNQNE